MYRTCSGGMLPVVSVEKILFDSLPVFSVVSSQRVGCTCIVMSWSFAMIDRLFCTVRFERILFITKLCRRFITGWREIQNSVWLLLVQQKEDLSIMRWKMPLMTSRYLKVCSIILLLYDLRTNRYFNRQQCLSQHQLKQKFHPPDARHIIRIPIGIKWDQIWLIIARQNWLRVNNNSPHLPYHLFRHLHHQEIIRWHPTTK